MRNIQIIASLILSGEMLKARAYAREYLDSSPDIKSDSIMINTNSHCEIALTAALSDLFARRLNQPKAAWTSEVKPISKTQYLLKGVELMPNLKTLCDKQSPPELKRYGFLAPPDFLTFV